VLPFPFACAGTDAEAVPETERNSFFVPDSVRTGLERREPADGTGSNPDD